AVVGIREQPGRPIIDLLSDYLRAKQLLLILDNCEHLIDASARIAEGLLRACPRLKILTSSREPLGLSGEISYRLPPLSLPADEAPLDVDASLKYDCVRLFVDRARSVQSHFRLDEKNARAIIQICTRLDGIPLAVELAAARVPVLSVEQIASRLDDRFRLL